MRSFYAQHEAPAAPEPGLDSDTASLHSVVVYASTDGETVS